ncbi:restriction endonuclease subunit S [Pasteurellaceae bacterium 22721_9_1]
MSKLSEIVVFNPTRSLKKGTVTSFIEMASLPTNARYIEKIELKEFSGSGTKFKNGDVLFARITPCLENGKTAQVFELKDDEVAFGSTEFIVMSAKEPEFDQDYLYYFAQLPEFREYAKSRMEGTSGRQRVSWQSLSEFEFNFPDKENRKNVGAFLSAFDQKIQLNTQINQTLEQIAQAIFKSWFIDFDPVRAKAAAKAQGATDDQADQAAMGIISGKSPAELATYRQTHPEDYNKLAQLAHQFPSELDVIDGVEVPKGWDISVLSDISSMRNGYAFKSSEWTDEGLPVIKIGSVKPMIVEVEGNGFVSEENQFSRPNCCRPRNLRKITT